MFSYIQTPKNDGRSHEVLAHLMNRTRNLLWLLASASVLLATGFAHEPLTAEQIAQMKEEGTFEERMQRARRLAPEKLGGGLGPTAAYKLRKEALRASGMSPADISRALFGGRAMAFPYAAQPELKSSGTVKTLTVLVDFKDHRAATELPGMTPSVFQQNIYGPGTVVAQAFAPYESVNAYYRRASQGKVDVQGDVLGWYKFPKNRNDYKPNTHMLSPEQKAYFENAALFDIVSEALTSFDATHDFQRYDNDNDGDIDLVTILYAGPPTGWMSFWWAYRWEFFIDAALTRTFDGKRLKQFVFQFVSKRDQSDFDPLTLLHEMGHAFGLPDYYDYDEDVGPAGGVGRLDMMDANWGNQNAFSRWLLDWIKPEVIGAGTPTVRQLVASGSTLNSNKAIAVFPNLHDSSAPSQELFLIENRFRMGNDGGVASPPNDGLLIWHVVAHPNASSDGFTLDNSYTDRKLIRLVRADADDDFPAKGQADAGTYFNAPKEFTPTSTPSSTGYTGSATNVVVKEISAPGETMTANIGFVSSPVPPLPLLNAGRLAAVNPELRDAAAGIEQESRAEAQPESIDVSAMEESLVKFRSASADELSAMWEESRKDATVQGGLRQTEVLQQLLLTQWAAKDGPKAARAVLGLPSNEFAREAFSRVMETWARHEPSSAAGWYFDPKNRKTIEEGKLAAGTRFAHAVFQWWARNDFKKAVTMLDQVRISEMDGALSALNNIAAKEGVTASVLKEQLSTLKQNRKAIEAVNHLQEARRKIEVLAVDPQVKEQFRKLLER